MNFASSGSQFVRWYSGSTARCAPWEAAERMKDMALAWLESIAMGYGQSVDAVTNMR